MSICASEKLATLTVAATDSRDMNYAWNNLGRCVDVFAPGVRLLAAAGQNRCAKRMMDAFAAKSTTTTMVSNRYMATIWDVNAAAIAAGAAAVFSAKGPNLGRRNKGMDYTKCSSRVVLLESSSLLVTANRMLRVH